MPGRTYGMCLATSRRLIRDVKATDGGLSAAWRLVRKGGRVRMYGRWWQHDALKEYEGCRVWMDNTDYWYSECSAATERFGRGDTIICVMKA